MSRFDEAIECYRKAIELDPINATAHFSLGNTLWLEGRLNEAINCYKKSIEIHPRGSYWPPMLHEKFNTRVRVDEILKWYRIITELDPKWATGQLCLGMELSSTGRDDEAIVCFKKAIELEPKSAAAHGFLAGALQDKGQLDDAIDCYRRAIELDPEDAVAHSDLGFAMLDKGQVDDAIASHRKAIELEPRYERAYSNLGNALLVKGQVDDAIASHKKAIELDPVDANAQAQLANARRMAVARDRLPAFQDGSYTPATNDERIGLADWCGIRKLHHAAAGLYAAAFAADPRLADDLKAITRYNAARCATRAADGQGDDAANLDDAERARLRKQALGWLRADLALLAQELESAQAAERGMAERTLRHWRQDADLAGIRDAEALAKLPEDEREAFQALWAEVDGLLGKTSEK
jgi:tetratricopeptide (TPR) repeat protein